MRATTNLLVGTILVVASLTLFGLFNPAWVCVAAMALFSVGEMLVSNGMDASQVTEAALPAGEAFHNLVEVTGETPEALTRLLYETHNIGMT